MVNVTTPTGGHGSDTKPPGGLKNPNTTKPLIVKAPGSTWQCRSPEFWGCGYSKEAAYARWAEYMNQFHG